MSLDPGPLDAAPGFFTDGTFSGDVEIAGDLDVAGTTTEVDDILSGDLTVNGEILAAEFIRHLGDTNTYLRFQADEIHLQAGGVLFIQLETGGQDEYHINPNNADVDVIFENDTDTTLTIDGSTSPFILVDTDKQLRFRDGGLFLNSSTDSRLVISADGSLLLSTPEFILNNVAMIVRTPNTDNAYAAFLARDSGVGAVEIARMQGAADPYFQGTLGIVLSPISQPSAPVEGWIIYNSGTDKLDFWNGAAWETITSST